MAETVKILIQNLPKKELVPKAIVQKVISLEEMSQKRAEAVAKALALQGARDAQVDAVSFGKERPAAQGSDESAWAKNRRAELTTR